MMPISISFCPILTASAALLAYYKQSFIKLIAVNSHLTSLLHTLYANTYPVDDEPFAILSANKASVEGLVTALAILDIHDKFCLLAHFPDLIICVPLLQFSVLRMLRFHF